MAHWRESKETQDLVERQLHGLQSLAPRASSDLRDALDRAFVRFYEFTGRFNRQLHTSPATPEWYDLFVGLQSLEDTRREVRAAVTPRLLELAMEEVALPRLFPVESERNLSAKEKREDDVPPQSESK